MEDLQDHTDDLKVWQGILFVLMIYAVLGAVWLAYELVSVLVEAWGMI